MNNDIQTQNNFCQKKEKKTLEWNENYKRKKDNLVKYKDAYQNDLLI